MCTGYWSTCFPCGQFQTWPFPLFREPKKRGYYPAHPGSININLRKEVLEFQENSNQTSEGVAMTNGP